MQIFHEYNLFTSNIGFIRFKYLDAVIYIFISVNKFFHDFVTFNTVNIINFLLLLLYIIITCY